MGLLPLMVSVAVGITTLSALSHSTACLAVSCLAPILFTVLRENPHRQVLSTAGSAWGGEYLQHNCTPVLGQQASRTGSSCVTRTRRNRSDSDPRGDRWVVGTVSNSNNNQTGKLQSPMSTGMLLSKGLRSSQWIHCSSTN